MSIPRLIEGAHQAVERPLKILYLRVLLSIDPSFLAPILFLNCS
jgi:hypothetical protein